MIKTEPTTPVFVRETEVGRIGIEPLDPDRDLADLHAWVSHPKSRFWGMQHADRDRVRTEYQRICADDHHHAWLGRIDGRAMFLAESYRPENSELADHYPVRPGDIGMHLLIAPTDEPRHGTTDAVLRTLMLFLFADLRHDRVVVEPDVENVLIAAKNSAAGFVVEQRIELSDKRAALSFCTRTQFARSPLGRTVIR